MKIHASNETLLSALIILIASLLSEISYLFYLQKGETLTYYDAIVHLNIARETLDSLNPGISHLVTLWLPLPHMLMLPFIWSDFLWHTGMAGSLVSMCAYVITVLFTVKIAKLVTNNYLAGIVAGAIVGLNPNLLYLQTTPMTESLALATMSPYLYYLIKWRSSNKLSDLILAGICGFLATITRYEAWILVSFGTLFLLWVRYKKTPSQKEILVHVGFVYSGIVAWIFAHYMVSGNPFAFVTGFYSAKVQQDALVAVHALPTKENFFLTLLTYTWDIVALVGMSIVCVALLSVVIFIIKEKKRQTLVSLLLACAPLIASIITLYLGITVMYVPQVAIQHTFGAMSNMRYGILSLPAVALAASLLAARNKYLGFGLLVIIFLQVLFIYHNNLVFTLNEPLRADSSYTITNPVRQVTHILQTHCNHTTTLMMLFVHGEEALESTLPLKDFLSEGDGAFWQAALQNPTTYAGCIVMDAHTNRLDQVRTALFTKPILAKQYRLLLKNKRDLVYEKIK